MPDFTVSTWNLVLISLYFLLIPRDEQIKRINDLQDYISQQTTYLTEFDEALVRRWIKQITLWDDRITVELKSGISVDVDA